MDRIPAITQDFACAHSMFLNATASSIRVLESCGIRNTEVL